MSDLRGTFVFISRITTVFNLSVKKGSLFGLLSMFSMAACATGGSEGIPHIYMDFESASEPYEVMPSRKTDPSGAGNGCMGGEAWNEYYKFNVCVAPTCELTDYCIERSSKYARSGTQSLRFFLKPTSPDQWPAGEATHRAELAPHHNSPVDRYPKEGDEFWYSISYYFPSDFMFAPREIENDIRFIIAQWQHGSPGSPIIALEVMGDHLVLQRKSGVSEHSDWIDPVSIGQIKRGQWMDIVVQAKWSKKNGLVNIWVNGQQSYSQTDIQTIYRDLNVGGGFKIGLYYWRWKEMQSVQNSLDAGITYREIYIDEVHEYQGPEGFTMVSPSQSALPITWLKFEVILQNNQSARVEWQTGSEINNDHFIIERSVDGRDWIIIDHVKGAGNSAEILNYQITDLHPLPGLAYYRIKQVDFDGEFSYSQIKNLQVPVDDGVMINVFPNPAVNALQLEGSTEDFQDLVIYNVMGQDLMDVVAVVQNGPTSMELDVSGLPPGIFTLKSKTFARQILKQ